jgi:hypothetical protein
MAASSDLEASVRSDRGGAQGELDDADRLDEAAAELNRQVSLHVRRLVVAVVLLALASGLAGAAYVVGLLDGLRQVSRISAWTVALAFTAPLLSVLMLGDALLPPATRRHTRHMLARCSARHGVKASDLEPFALPIGGMPQSTPQGSRSRSRRRIGLALVVPVLLGALVVLGGDLASLLPLLVGLGLTALLLWYLGWRAPR